MKKENFYRIYAAAFIGVCLVPAVGTPFFKGDAAKEKRELAKFPSLVQEGKINVNFFDEFETYFSENFAFRQQLVNADGRLKSALTHTSANDDVIVGKDGWLYYNETISDFQRINTLKIREINGIANNLRIIDKYCKIKGADFIFFSAPNKNTLYPENMPYNYIQTDKKSNLENLTETLSADDFYMDMKSQLEALNSSTALYHKTDTHWNNFGAYAAHTMLMNKLGKGSCGVGNGWYTANDRLGDLAAMLYPVEDAKDMQLHNDYEYEYTYTSRFRGLDDVSITTENLNAAGNLIMFRDSFGEAILPYMAEQFATAEFSRAVPYNLTKVKEGDSVIIELVERNLGNLLKSAPVMEAPVVGVFDIEAEKGDSSDAVLKIAENNGMTHIYGILPESFFKGENYRIIVEAEGTSFEAFNCFEENQLKEYKCNSYGFSLYLPKETNTDIIKVTVLNENIGAVYTEFLN
ncbi:MAG: hypothetical protein IKV85_05670 [Ruminococcus sp.]|nr:hypothetical protein [Ruminococcus sp.]